MKKTLSTILAAGLLFYPFAAYEAEYGSQPPQGTTPPPLAQPLVREGDFAINLAAKLNLGTPMNEALAEDMLAKSGIVPQNGWLSDYPVTPQIVGQLQDAIAKAASEGKLPMTADEATQGLYSLTKELGLPTPASQGSTGGAPIQVPQSTPEYPTSTEVTDYYYDQGPPIITYYQPPPDYGYLYAWVPYPVFWFGFWYPGFYICHNFTTTAVVFYRNVHPGHRGIVTNRVIDPVTRRVAVVEPVSRTSSGAIRSVTMLRTENGQTFRNLAEWRKEAPAPRMETGRPRTTSNSSSKSEGFRSSEARNGAAAIYSRSVERMRHGISREGGRSRDGEQRSFTPRIHERPFNAPTRSGAWQSILSGSEGVRQITAPNTPQRVYAGPGPYGNGRIVTSRSSARRMGVAPTGGGGKAGRPYTGGGWQGRSGGGRISSGAVCRGRC